MKAVIVTLLLTTLFCIGAEPKAATPAPLPAAAQKPWIQVAAIDVELARLKAIGTQLSVEMKDMTEILQTKYPQLGGNEISGPKSRTGEAVRYRSLEQTMRQLDVREKQLRAARAENVAFLHRIGVKDIPNPLILKPVKPTTAASRD